MKNILNTFTFIWVSAFVFLSSCTSTANTEKTAVTIQSQLDALSLRITELQDALNQAEALLKRLPESDKDFFDKTKLAETPSNSDLAESAIDMDSVYTLLAMGRGNGEAVDGSNLIIQSDGSSGNYLSHRNYGPKSGEKAYLEIQRNPDTGIELFLVLQQVTESQAESFGLHGGDLSLAETFPISLPEYSHREILENPSHRLERIYIPVDRTTLQTLGRMANEHRGQIILKGLDGEERVLLDEEKGRALKEVLSTFIELRSAATL